MINILVITSHRKSYNDALHHFLIIYISPMLKLIKTKYLSKINPLRNHLQTKHIKFYNNCYQLNYLQLCPSILSVIYVDHSDSYFATFFLHIKGIKLFSIT